MPSEFTTKLEAFREAYAQAQGRKEDALMSIFQDLEKHEPSFDDYNIASRIVDPDADYVIKDKNLYLGCVGQKYPIKAMLLKIAAAHGYLKVVNEILRSSPNDEAAMLVNDNNHPNRYKSSSDWKNGIVSNNVTPLSYALRGDYTPCREPNLEIVKSLIAYGADVNFSVMQDNSHQKYPLNNVAAAIKTRNVEFIKVLTNAGADITGALGHAVYFRDQLLDSRPSFSYEINEIQFCLLACHAKRSHKVKNPLVEILYTGGSETFNKYLDDRTRIIPLRELQEALAQFRYIKRNITYRSEFYHAPSFATTKIKRYISDNYKNTFFKQIRNRCSIFVAEHFPKVYNAATKSSARGVEQIQQGIVIPEVIDLEKNAKVNIQTVASTKSQNETLIENLPMAPNGPILIFSSVKPDLEDQAEELEKEKQKSKQLVYS